MPKQTAIDSQEATPEFVGIGGWLLFPAVVLVLAPVVRVFDLFGMVVAAKSLSHSSNRVY
jgi:hypothetical protein